MIFKFAAISALFIFAAFAGKNAKKREMAKLIPA